jgi:hypothetical protein
MRILLVLLAGCYARDDDETHVGGSVVLPPAARSEADDAGNGLSGGAESLALAPYGTTFLDGTLSDTTDVDWYAISFVVPGSLAFTAELGGVATEVRVSLYDLDALTGDPPAPTLIDSSDLASGDRVEWAAEPNETYGLSVEGLVSAPGMAYHLAFEGPSPDTAGFLVGAYGTDALASVGPPLGGAECGPFVDQGDGSFAARYDIRYLAVVDTPSVDPKADHAPHALGTLYTDHVKEAWLFAGSFASLDDPLGGGTLYSANPVHVSTSTEEVEDTALGDTVIEAADLAIDTLSPGGVGHTYLDQEPNDVAITAGGFSIDPEGAQEVGEIDGPGFSDLFLGTVRIFSADVGLVHDNDVFAFTVPEPVTPTIHLDWEDPSVTLLVAIYDDKGLIYDFSATNGQKPADGGGVVTLDPGRTWYLGLGGYKGRTGAETAYTLELSLARP